MRAALAVAIVALSTAAIADEDPDTEIARRHFEKGASLYDGRDYGGALAEFRAARDVRPAPALDYNIARCLDRMERFDEAIVEYDKYLAGNPPDANDVRARVAVLKSRVHARSGSADSSLAGLLKPEPEATAPPRATPVYKKWWLWTALAAVVVAGAGVAIGLTAAPHDADAPATTFGTLDLSFH